MKTTERPTDILAQRILSEEQYPSWGSEWGNLFEVGLLSRRYFTCEAASIGEFRSLNKRQPDDLKN